MPGHSTQAGVVAFLLANVLYLMYFVPLLTPCHLNYVGWLYYQAMASHPPSRPAGRTPTCFAFFQPYRFLKSCTMKNRPWLLTKYPIALYICLSCSFQLPVSSVHHLSLHNIIGQSHIINCAITLSLIFKNGFSETRALC